MWLTDDLWRHIDSLTTHTHNGVCLYLMESPNKVKVEIEIDDPHVHAMLVRVVFAVMTTTMKGNLAHTYEKHVKFAFRLPTTVLLDTIMSLLYLPSGVTVCNLCRNRSRGMLSFGVRVSHAPVLAITCRTLRDVFSPSSTMVA